MTPNNPKRRDFLQATAAGLAVAGMAGSAEGRLLNEGGVPTRPLGRTGQTVSLHSLGGHPSTNRGCPARACG